MAHGSSRFCDGITRRDMIQAGLAGTIGLSLPELLRLRAQSARAADGAAGAQRDTAVIYVEMAGGPTQHETYDPKPAAPQEYRGPYRPIESSVAGVRLSQLMVEQARIMDKLAVIRSVHHNTGSHRSGSHLVQTGYYLQDRQNRENEMPCIGSATARVRGANAFGVPAYVAVPREMRYGGAGWLGEGFNPFETVRSADRDNFRVPNLSLIRGLTPERLQDRRKLLKGFDQTRRIIDNRGTAEAVDQFTRSAFELVAGERARKAFDIDAEDDALRDRYGRNSTGQNLLLSRRLVEHGVTFVTVRVGGWDDHRQIEQQLKRNAPAFDRGVAALVEDLHERGLAKTVMVVCMGEFGRTPRVNRRAGRDHWGRLMSVMLAGGGLPGGTVVGSSDRKGAVPVESPYRPESVLAMLYRHLGIDPKSTFVDPSGRPRYLLEHTELIEELV